MKENQLSALVQTQNLSVQEAKGLRGLKGQGQAGLHSRGGAGAGVGRGGGVNSFGSMHRALASIPSTMSCGTPL